MKETNIWTVVVVALFLVLLLPMLNVADEGAIEYTDVDNETITVDYSAPVAVEHADADDLNESVSVYNATGDELVEGTDYDWAASDGEVTWYNTTSTTDGEQATISYSYGVLPETTGAVSSIFAAVSAPLGYLLLMTAVGATFFYAFGRGGGW